MIEADSTKFAVAMQLFAKLRRSSGRTIDVVWLLKDPAYAREVLRAVRAVPDAEMAQLAERFESLMFRPVPAAAAESPVSESHPRKEEDISEHYIGHLR